MNCLRFKSSVRYAGRRIFLSLLTMISLMASATAMRSQTAYAFPGMVDVGGTALVEAVPVAVQATATLGSIKVLTAGSANLDYTLVSGCATGALYASGQTCTVSVQFLPLSPGVRRGAIVLLDTGGNVMATRQMTGVGHGPLAVMVAGELTTAAGNGHLADDGRGATGALSTAIHEPAGVATDGAGNLFYTDNGNNLIRRVDAAAGTVATIAGTGVAGFSPDGTLAVNAQLNTPSQMVTDGAGNLVFADSGNNAIREIVAATGKIVTVAGTGAVGYSGDGFAATAATLSAPQGLAFDLAGNLYIADTGNNVVRVVDASSGTISTFAGTGVAGFSPDGTTATLARLNTPWGVFAAQDGSVYIADFGNNCVRRVAGGKIATIAGSGSSSFGGDGGPAVQADLNRPSSVWLDAAGDVYIADSENNAVRKISGASGKIMTIAGNGSPGYGGDGLDANVITAELDKPYAVALDGAGNLLIADRIGLRIRGVGRGVASIRFDAVKATNTSAPVAQTIENDGNATLTIANVDPTTNSAVSASLTTCKAGTSLAVGDTCVVGAEFKPATVGSAVAGLITVTSNSAGPAASIGLTGDSLSIFPTVVTVTGSPNPAALGDAVTLTATVTSDNTARLTGTVSFYDGRTLLGGVAQILNSTTGSASLTTATLSLGSHSITAVYSGDSGDATSTSTPAFIEVVKQDTAFTIAGTPNPSRVYDSVTFTGTLTTTPANGTVPTGNVVFSSDGNPLPNGTVTLVNGIATYSTDLLGQGTHSITATYAGDSVNLASTATPYVQTVDYAASTTLLSTSNASVALATPVTFTATVTGTPTSTPTGNVVFKDGATTIGTTPLNSSGVATLTTSTLSAGTHSIAAVYQGDNDYGTSASAGVVQTIEQIATTTAIATSANPVVAGAAVKFTVTVTAAATTGIALTGRVTLMQGSTVLGSGAVTPGTGSPATATFVVSSSSFTPGAQTITALYSGDANYVTSSNSVGLTVTSATTTTVLAASSTTLIAGKPLALTATVTGNGGSPTGTVTFTDGANVLGVVKLNGSGTATLTTSTLAVGSHTFGASYSGDTDNGTSNSGPVTVTVQSATTAVVLTPAKNPVDFGQTLNLAIAVSGNGGIPAGVVTILDGATPLGTVGLVNGAASFSTASLTDGSHALTASYAGDANDSASVSPAVNVVVLQTVSLAVSSTSPNPSTARANVHLVATITALQGIQPTGSVTFLDGGVVLGSGAIVGSTAVFDTATLTVGNHSIVASYAGDAATEPLQSAPYLQTVNAAGTTIGLASSANPATFGIPVVFSATATSAAGALTGTVLFQEGGVTLGQGTLSGGTATFTTGALTPGLHTLIAAYQGDANDAPATSAPLVERVERATSVALTSSQNPLLTLAPVVITATVSDGATDLATGTVAFTLDGAAAGTAQIVNGAATLSLPSLTAGTHTFAASYAGDSVDLPSASAPFAETVQLRPTTDALDSSATSLTGGQQITLSSIIRWTGPVTPTGTVTFLNGTTVLGKVPVDGQGLATLTVLLAGTSASLTSSYSGDASYAPSTSPETTVPIAPAPNISFTVTPNTVAMQAGQHTNVVLTLASVNNFTDTFALGCAGLPLMATCTFAQDKVTVAAGGVQHVTLTVDTGSPLLGGTLSANTGIAAAFLMLVLVAMPRKKMRRLKGLLLLLAMAGVVSTVTGCASVQVNSTPAGTYSFQVTAVGQTGVTQFAPITMNVTK